MGPRKCEEYKGSRFYNGDCTLVVDVWMNRVDEDVSGLTFEEWDPSADTNASQVPVGMIVNSSELCATGFDLREVIPLQLEAVARRGPQTDLRHPWVSGGMYSPWTTTMSWGHTVTEYELDTSGLQPMSPKDDGGLTISGNLKSFEGLVLNCRVSRNHSWFLFK